MVIPRVPFAIINNDYVVEQSGQLSRRRFSVLQWEEPKRRAKVGNE